MKYLLLLFILSCSQKNSVVYNNYALKCVAVDGGFLRIERCVNKEVICYVAGREGIWCVSRGVINE